MDSWAGFCEVSGFHVSVSSRGRRNEVGSSLNSIAIWNVVLGIWIMNGQLIMFGWLILGGEGDGLLLFYGNDTKACFFDGIMILVEKNEIKQRLNCLNTWQKWIKIN